MEKDLQLAELPLSQAQIRVAEFSEARENKARENLANYKKILEETPERKNEFLETLTVDESLDMQAINTLDQAMVQLLKSLEKLKPQKQINPLIAEMDAINLAAKVYQLETMSNSGIAKQDMRQSLVADAKAEESVDQSPDTQSKDAMPEKSNQIDGEAQTKAQENLTKYTALLQEDSEKAYQFATTLDFVEIRNMRNLTDQQADYSGTGKGLLESAEKHRINEDFTKLRNLYKENPDKAVEFLESLSPEEGIQQTDVSDIYIAQAKLRVNELGEERVEKAQTHRNNYRKLLKENPEKAAEYYQTLPLNELQDVKVVHNVDLVQLMANEERAMWREGIQQKNNMKLNSVHHTLINQADARMKELWKSGKFEQTWDNAKKYYQLFNQDQNKANEYLKTLTNEQLLNLKVVNDFNTAMVKTRDTRRVFGANETLAELYDKFSMQNEHKVSTKSAQSNSVKLDAVGETRREYPTEEMRNFSMPSPDAAEFNQNQSQSNMMTEQERYEQYLRKGNAERINDLMGMMNGEREQLLRERMTARLRENMAAKPEDRKTPNELLTSIAQEVNEILDAPRDQARAAVQGVAMERLKQDFPGVRLNQTQENILNPELADNIKNIKHMLESGGKELTAENVDLALNKLNGRLQDNPKMYQELEQAGAALKRDLYTQNLGQSTGLENYNHYTSTPVTPNVSVAPNASEISHVSTPVQVSTTMEIGGRTM